ncbi:MAG: hypothetical protein N2689_09395, partial [Verrucomicrobiae bacterium]|nr:hypothetical protein [Verrucomicrobiae bacterium]
PWAAPAACEFLPRGSFRRQVVQPWFVVHHRAEQVRHRFANARERPAELRLGCKNGWKVWLNGKLLAEREEYHRGMQIDQYPLACQLQAGRNTILVKVCQNELVEKWTVEWQFQLRVCDHLGTAILPCAPPSFVSAK